MLPLMPPPLLPSAKGPRTRPVKSPALEALTVLRPHVFFKQDRPAEFFPTVEAFRPAQTDEPECGVDLAGGVRHGEGFCFGGGVVSVVGVRAPGRADQGAGAVAVGNVVLIAATLQVF